MRVSSAAAAAATNSINNNKSTHVHTQKHTQRHSQANTGTHTSTHTGTHRHSDHDSQQTRRDATRRVQVVLWQYLANEAPRQGIMCGQRGVEGGRPRLVSHSRYASLYYFICIIMNAIYASFQLSVDKISCWKRIACCCFCFCFCFCPVTRRHFAEFVKVNIQLLRY